MMANFTPGDWEYDSFGEGVLSQDGWICTIGYDHEEDKKGGMDEVMQNALLISLAPRMYSICERLSNLWSDTPGPDRVHLISLMKEADGIVARMEETEQ